MSPDPSPPDQAATRAWQPFRIASAAVFLVLLDTTAVLAVYSQLRADFRNDSAAYLS